MGLICNGKLDAGFIKSISNIVSDISKITDEIEMTNKYLDNIKMLRTEFQEEDFFDSIEKYVNSPILMMRRKGNPILDRVLSSTNLKSIIDPEIDTSVLNIISEGDSKQNILDETPLEKIERENQINSFLDKYFPLSSDARLAFEQKFKNDIILNLFLDKTGDLWTMNTSSNEMDLSIKSFLKELLNIVDNYIHKYYPGLSKAYDSQLTLLGKINYLKKAFDSGSLVPLSRIDLIKIPNMESSPQKERLLGYTSTIALIHFDELIGNVFGDALDISYNKDYSDNVLVNKTKYNLNLGNKSAKTWRDDKSDIDETGEIGSIILLYVESLNVYRDGIKTPQKLTFSDIKAGIGAINGLLFDNKLMSREISYDTLGEQLISDLQNLYGTIGYNTIKLNYKTLGQLIAKAKINPIMYYPIVFAILDKNKGSYFGGKYQIKQTIHSIYKNIFDYSNPNSLLNIKLRSKSQNTTSDLYGFFNTLLINVENTPYMEYKENIDGSREVINITLNNSNRRLNNQVYSWEGTFNITIPQNFRTCEILDFETNDGKYIPQLIVKINGTDYELFMLGTSTGVNTTLRKLKNSSVLNNSLIKEYEIINLQDFTPEIYNFISEIFGFQVDENFVRTFKDIRGENHLYEIFDVIGDILYNYKVGKTLKSTTQLDYEKNISQFYNGTVPKNSRGSLLPELIPQLEYLKVLAISETRDIQQGFTGESTARDGEGKLLSIMGLSSLMSKYMELSYNHNFGKDSIAGQKDFSIYRLIKGIEFVRDYNGVDSKSQGIKFSGNEFFNGSFLYDLYDGIAYEDSESKYSEVAEGKDNVNKLFIRIFGPVISDKNKLPKLLISPLDKIIINGEEKYIKDLTAEDIHLKQREEFGNYYSKLRKNIIKEFNKFNEIQENGLTIIQDIFGKYSDDIPSETISFNYDDNFEQINKFVEFLQNKGVKVTTSKILHDCVAYLQKLGKSIKTIDGVSYISDKKGFLHNNPALFHQLSIYGKSIKTFKIDSNLKFDKNQILETPEQARIRQQFQLISEFITKDIKISIDKSLDKANAIAYSRNKDFMSGHYIAFAKINGEQSLNITDKSSLKTWYPYRSLLKLFGENIPAELNVDNPKFRLLLVLDYLNNTRRLRTLLIAENRDLILQNKELKKLLLNHFKKQSAIEIIENDLTKKNPRWKPETITRKALEFIDSKSKEELSNYIARLALDNIVDESIINNKDNSVISRLFNEISNLEGVQERLNSTYSLEINPEIEKHNLLNQWLSESFLLTSVGSFIAHPGNNSSKTIWNYEKSQIGLQIKRNVSHTATKHREIQNSLFGIAPKIKILLVQDEKNSITTIKGDLTDAKTSDGATYYNMTMNLLDNNSLGADAMGLDKKPFAHAYDSTTGIGFILKTAGFVVNNQRIRDNQKPGKEGRDALMNRIMNDTIKWTDILRLNNINSSFFNYLVSYTGEQIELNPWYYYNNEEKQWYKRSNLRIDKNGNTIYDEVKVYNNGEENGTPVPSYPVKIDSNYQLWKKIFGGEWSGHFLDGYLTYENDDSSTYNLVYIMNNAGIALDESQIKTLENVLLVLKESQISMFVTMGSTKFGAINTNSTEIYSNPEYEPTYMEINTSDLGELLDAEHDSEGGHVSLMTLVVNALGARGYSRLAAQECYEALESIILQNYSEGFDGLLDLIGGDSSKLKLFVYNLLFKSLKNVSVEDGNILSALVQGIKKLSLGNIEDYEGNFAFSDPRVFNALQSKIASAIEKSVRLKMDGGQYVLNPSSRRFELIGNSLSSKISPKELENLQKKANKNPLILSSLIRFGRSYFIKNKVNDFVGQLVKVDSYEDFKRLKDAIKSGLTVIEAYKLFDGTPVTRDLATYECIFYDNNGNEYTIWDIDIVRELHTIKDNKFKNPELDWEVYWNKFHNGELLDEWEEVVLNDTLLKLGIPNKQVDIKKYLQYRLQKTLDALGNGTASTVQVDGRTITIDKSRTKVSPYEAILPMIYKTEFGLKEGDLVKDIQNDLFFFVKRAAGVRASKVSPAFYDLELKVGSGKHIYLCYAKGKKLMQTPIEIETIVENGQMYRSENGKKLYPIPSHIENGEYVADVEIYKSGNSEIINTENITDFLNCFDYDTILFGKVQEEYLGKIVEQLSKSTNEVSQNLIKRIETLVRTRISNHKLGLLNNQGDSTLKILVDKGLSEKILAIENPENVDINFIIENDVAINELFNSNLVSKGNAEYEEGIEKLLKIITRPDLTNFDLILQLLMEQYPFLKDIVKKGIRKHTSFLTSLEAVVSRTPAQSHQSFMAMKVAGFDLGKANSIYVSLMQIFLQGSDFDIDKANVLGLKFHNGELITWSPYFDLSDKTNEEISENLPFPTGRPIRIDTMQSRAFDVNELDYDNLSPDDNLIVIRDSKGNVVSAINAGNGLWIISGDINSYTGIRALINKIPQGDTILYQVENGYNKIENRALGIIDGVNTKEYDYVADFNAYINSLDFTEDGDYTLDSIIKLIRTVNGLLFIDPQFEDEIDIVNKHNMWLNNKAYRRKYALYNFISIKTKNISKNPINLIQGQSGIDEATGYYKGKVNPDNIGKVDTITGKPLKVFDRLSATSTTSDGNTIMSKIESLLLTLSGKLNTGIVASAMKTFEAMSLYYYNILAFGTEELLKDLLKDVTINGKTFSLLANSYAKNIDSTKSEDVKKALLSVDNLEDAFLVMSVFLSLSTDNAKDPTLSKYNAGPEMIGCYTAAIILGMNIDDCADLIISDTGLLLSDLQKGNVFNESLRKFNRLSLAINFLVNPPSLSISRYDDNTIEKLTKLAKIFGIKIGEKKIKNEDLENALRNKRQRRKVRKLIKFILNPDEAQLNKSDEELINQNIRDIQNDPDYWSWNQEEFDKLRNKDNLGKRELNKLEKLKKTYDIYIDLKTLLEAYLELQLGKHNVTAENDLKELKKLLESLSNKESLKELKKLRWENESLDDYLKSVRDWISYRYTIDSDIITDENGGKHVRLWEIKKLNDINEEMGALRKVLSLNQGLPNLILDLINWIRGFRTILKDAINRKSGISEDDEAFEDLKILNSKLLNKDFEDDLLIDLNNFLNNPEYQQAVIKAYSRVKLFVNIMAVMANIPHYRGYLKAMNLLYEGSKSASILYKELARISDWILPKLNIKDSLKLEQFLKTLTPVIFRKINSNFLRSRQEIFRIPIFNIVNGELKEERDESGNLKYRNIRLGSEESNKIFSDYVVNYLYPYLKRVYPDNAFVKAITLRTYKFNPDHNLTINVAKSQSYNMKNPLENVAFNEIKLGLLELNSVKLPTGTPAGIVTALFYYNLIAYNGLPGILALTDLFEDIVVNDQNTAITSYTNFLRELDKSDKSVFSKQEEDLLLRLLAPIVSGYENISYYPYSYLMNPETNKYELVRPKQQDLSNEDIPEDSEAADIIAQQMAELEGLIDDIEGFGKAQRNISMRDLMEKLGVEPAGIRKTLDNDSSIVFGRYEILNDIYSIVEFNRNPIENIKNHQESINLSINGQIMSLKLFTDKAIEKGWSEDEVFSIFKIITKIRDDGTKYNTLDLDTLRHGLKSRNNNKPNCNG